MSDTNICLTLIMSSTIVKSSRAAHRRSARTVVTSVKEICASFGGEKSLQAKPLSYKVTLNEKLEILETLDETVLESIENDAEIDKEIQESADFRGFLQETCTEIDLCLKEYVKNEQPKQGATTEAVDTSVISSLSSKQASLKVPKIIKLFLKLTFKVFGTHTTQPFMEMRIFQMSTKWLTYLVYWRDLHIQQSKGLP